MNANVAIPPAVATTSQKYQGRKAHPLLTLKTTDSKIMDSIAQNIVMAIPMATKLHIFIFLVILRKPHCSKPYLAILVTNYAWTFV